MKKRIILREKKSITRKTERTSTFFFHFHFHFCELIFKIKNPKQTLKNTHKLKLKLKQKRMGELWRSKEMQLVQLFIQKDAAHDTIDELGEVGLIQFQDLNPDVSSFQRYYVNEVKRFDEMERRLRFLSEQIKREEAQLSLGQTLVGVSGVEVTPLSDFDEHKRPVFDVDELEETLERHEGEVRDNNQSLEELLRGYVESLELKYVLLKGEIFFRGDNENGSSSSESSRRRSNGDYQQVGQHDEDSDDHGPKARLTRGMTATGIITGVILKAKLGTFERVLWRTLHGNLLQKSEDIDEEIEDPATGEMQEKAVFATFFHGEQSEIKIRKICEAFGAHIYECPADASRRQALLSEVEGRLEDAGRVIEGSRAQRRETLALISTRAEEWRDFVLREKAIYHVLNMCQNDPGKKSMVAQGWIPKERADDVLAALDAARKSSGESIPTVMEYVKTREEPPTYYPITPFTSCFYNIVDSYGTARYGEVSPTPLSIITFPFLFAIMLGDAGHALLMMLAAIAMIVAYPRLQGKKLNEIFDMLLGGRYMILLMSIFSIYTGLLYNEIFCIPYPLFQRTYHDNNTHGDCVYGGECVKDKNTYPFGIDPIWREADNELFIYNSLKMKVSIVFGVVQMLAGTVLSLFNHIHYRKPLDIIFGFVPQLLFMLCTFGYMTFLIFYKWLAPSVNSDSPYIINVVIDMFLKFGSLPDEDFLYNGQNAVQVALVIVIPKPIVQLILLKRAHKASSSSSNNYEHLETHSLINSSIEDKDDSEKQEAAQHDNGGAEAEAEAEEEHDDELAQFKFGDEFIQNAIHAIEYILGCISNTASYLRLWALSLAHSQLSIVFYEQVFVLGLKSGNCILMFVCFSVWGGATIAILLMMEALSAFLHALRLHWVEFMNKFYLGDGYPFTPFSNKTAVEEARAAEETK